MRYCNRRIFVHRDAEALRAKQKVQDFDFGNEQVSDKLCRKRRKRRRRRRLVVAEVD